MTLGRDEPLRIGILGAGAVSQLVHLPLLTERADVRVVALADTNDMKARTIGERFGVERVVPDERLVQDGDLQAVVICTPNHRHEAQAIAALEAGLHVLVERPLALTAAGARRVIDAARAARRTVLVGMHHRFRPDVGALRSFVAGGELGRIYAGRVAWMHRRVNLRHTTWRQRPEEAGGGAFMDLGVQSLDLALWLLGSPTVRRVSAVFSSEEAGIEDAASVLIDTEEGIALSIEVSWNYTHAEDRHYARVLGLEGSGSLPPLEVFKQLGGRCLDVTPAQPRADEGGSYLGAYRREIDYFLRAARGLVDAPLPEEQVELMKVVEAIYESGREQHEVVF
jgi:predicted dehydrogenase